jgi:spore maturation protein CgeB
MINIVREQGTDYLFAGFLEKEMEKHQTDVGGTIWIEPKYGNDIQFSQDYLPDFKYNPYRFVFYTLPSLKKDIELSMGKNCALVTYAADPEFHKVQPVEKKYDVGFIGKQYYPERIKYLQVIEKFWPRSFLNLDKCPPIDIPLRLSECKVLFNHTRPEIDVNLRFFEEMALGCQVMLRTPYLNEFAEEGVHYMGYSSNEELVEVLDRLLKDDELRNKIARQAREHFLQHHTYKHRAQSIINHITDYYERNA